LTHGFLDDLPGERARRRKRRSTPPPPEADGAAVVYRAVRCPNGQCRSKKVPVYATKLPVRYHKCLVCGCRFKSIEEEEGKGVRG